MPSYVSIEDVILTKQVSGRSNYPYGGGNNSKEPADEILEEHLGGDEPLFPELGRNMQRI